MTPSASPQGAAEGEVTPFASQQGGQEKGRLLLLPASKAIRICQGGMYLCPYVSEANHPLHLDNLETNNCIGRSSIQP